MQGESKDAYMEEDPEGVSRAKESQGGGRRRTVIAAYLGWSHHPSFLPAVPPAGGIPQLHQIGHAAGGGPGGGCQASAPGM